MALLAEHHHCNPQGPQSPPPAVGLRMTSIGVIDPVRLANPSSAPLSILRSSELAQLCSAAVMQWKPPVEAETRGDTGTDGFWSRDRSSPDALVKMSDGWASFGQREYIRLPPSGPACIDCTAGGHPGHITAVWAGLGWVGGWCQGPAGRPVTRC